MRPVCAGSRRLAPGAVLRSLFVVCRLVAVGNQTDFPSDSVDILSRIKLANARHCQEGHLPEDPRTHLCAHALAQKHVEMIGVANVTGITRGSGPAGTAESPPKPRASRKGSAHRGFPEPLVLTPLRTPPHTFVCSPLARAEVFKRGSVSEKTPLSLYKTPDCTESVGIRGLKGTTGSDKDRSRNSSRAVKYRKVTGGWVMELGKWSGRGERGRDSSPGSPAKAECRENHLLVGETVSSPKKEEDDIFSKMLGNNEKLKLKHAGVTEDREGSHCLIRTLPTGSLHPVRPLTHGCGLWARAGTWRGVAAAPGGFRTLPVDSSVLGAQSVCRTRAGGVRAAPCLRGSIAMPHTVALLTKRSDAQRVGSALGLAAGVRPAWATAALSSVLIFTTVVDIVGNVLVILSVLRNRKLRNAGDAVSTVSPYLDAASRARRSVPVERVFSPCPSHSPQGLESSLPSGPAQLPVTEAKRDALSLRDLKDAGAEVFHSTDDGNVFVVSLAFADLLVALYPFPLVLHALLHGGWEPGGMQCKVSGFLTGLSVIGSIFNITGIAVNRYCYICHGLAYGRVCSLRNTLLLAALAWALAALAVAPNLLVGSLRYDPRVCSCTFTQTTSSSYTAAVVVVHFLVPIAVVTFCYLRIWVLVVRVRRKVKVESRPRLKPSDLRNFITMFVVFVLFAICWAPLNFIGLAVAIDPLAVAPRIPDWLFVVSYFMAYFNSCLNAIIYGLLNRNFRREYKRIVLAVWAPWLFVADTSRVATDGPRSKPSPGLNNNE
ncbi:melatonin receptor type 1B-B-like [Scleropages formosus]|uniref:Melatonin receptor type 1B-B-like n=1 Tax=Scleropages formosus TaxID=113540 RepID=A0A0N8JZJ1_SCLFO|nr:melatonin receptor type 1B-B-like [Scleropages formosus]